MKKLLVVCMALVMILGCCFAFTACGSKQVTEIEMVPVDITGEEYAFAVKKGDDELLAQVNKFFKEKSGEVEAIFSKYTKDGVDLSSFGTDKILTSATGADDELVVATNFEFPPFEYKVGDKIAGIDMEIAQLLATYLNKKLVVEHMKFEAVVTSVATLDKYDIGIAGLTINEARKKEVNFSDPYFGTTQVIITKKGDETFKGCDTVEKVEEKLASLKGDAAKCGGQKGTTSQFYVQGNEDFGFAGYKNLTFSAYESAAVAVNDMLNGNIAFVVVDKATGQALVSEMNK